MRPTHSKVTDHPGTVSRAKDGNCGACIYAISKGRKSFGLTPPLETGTPCTDCGRPMRRTRVPLKDAPGTVTGHNVVICVRDAERLKRAGQPVPTWETVQAKKELEPSNAPQELEAFVAARRRRGVPAEGLRLAA